jgi:hypothetical protein
MPIFMQSQILILQISRKPKTNQNTDDIDSVASLTTLAAIASEFNLSNANTLDKLKACFPPAGALSLRGRISMNFTGGKMALVDLIQQYSLTGTSAEVAAALNAQTVMQSITDLQTSTDLIRALGTADAEAALRGYELAMAGSAILRSQYQSLNSVGLDFSHPLVQASVDSMVAGGALSSALAAKVKALGIKQISPYEAWAGVGQVVTADQVTAALTPLVQDGVAFSLVVSVTPQLSCAMHMSRTALSGAKTMGVIESFSTSQAVNPNLTKTQQALVTAILALVSSYGN